MLRRAPNNQQYYRMPPRSCRILVVGRENMQPGLSYARSSSQTSLTTINQSRNPPNNQCYHGTVRPSCCMSVSGRDLCQSSILPPYTRRRLVYPCSAPHASITRIHESRCWPHGVHYYGTVQRSCCIPLSAGATIPQCKLTLIHAIKGVVRS